MAAKPTGALDPRLLFGLPVAVLVLLAVALAPAQLWFAVVAALVLGGAVAVADARRQPGGGLGLPAMRPTAAE